MIKLSFTILCAVMMGPAMAEDAASAVQNMVERFCGGSIERALIGLVQAGLVDSNQLALIVGKIKRRS